MGLYYYSIGLPSVKTILWHYRQATGHTAVLKNLLFKLKSVLTTCLPCWHGMAGLVYRPDRKAGWLVGRSVGPFRPALCCPSAALKPYTVSLNAYIVFTIHIENTTKSAGLNIGMLGIYIKHAWHTFHYIQIHFIILRKMQKNIGDEGFITTTSKEWIKLVATPNTPSCINFKSKEERAVLRN